MTYQPDLRFPHEWSADCPPADAIPAEGTVFRICEQESLTVQDFRTYLEMGKLPDAPPCRRAGLSVFRKRSDAEHRARLQPGFGRIVAKGTLLNEHGVTKQTGRPSHTTWWIAEGVDRVSIFSPDGEIT